MNKFPLVLYFLDLIWPFWAVQFFLGFIVGIGETTVVWWVLTCLFHALMLYMAFLRAKIAIHMRNLDS